MTYTLYHGDCLIEMDKIPDSSIDVLIIDPPYPDYWTELYKYNPALLDRIKDIGKKQLIFWSARYDFPLDYSAVHIWNKKIGVGVGYERIFERRGGSGCRVYSHYLINSTVAACYTGDIFTGHPSQKPLALMLELISEHTNEGDTVLDCTMGSGTTGVACGRLNRSFIGIEQKREYFDIAENRIMNAYGDFVRTPDEVERGQLSLFEVIQ